jgi:hypothetical protein
MSRYFFNLYECGTLVADDEGREVADLRQLHDIAMREARQIMAAEVVEGKLCLSCRIEVVDEDQRPVLLLPFKEAIALTGLG